ncbi:MAG TPA: precorrin-6y C5,15-methyltransferase (decarboxylating) subunit CbiE [Nitrospirae bacterium]|nr:precorrin-6Y C(5,15)-methyltransferase [decarboxylating] [bacterium BMS3Abin06]HDH13671.1 precorrin-6y C5,15-methyltransferase (decarboxylating) subunit CbiE [Nitrospirota bacterium]HDZ02742.1 precorrin-6y C5,15-methyltransferase (decarboxylating) subunit CbiE [Nitrospirota bacterium]
MNKLNVIGIGYRPLDKRARDVLLNSDVVLANSRLLEVFQTCHEYEDVKDRIIVHGSVYETLDYIVDNYREKKITLLATGDPMFFGIGRLVVEKLGQDAVEIYPDLSSIQVAFSRIRETSNNALLMSLHGGPDPAKRRKPEYEITDLPGLLKKHNKIAILTDKINNPTEIAKEILKPSALRSQLSALKMYVCEKLGYPDEKITEGRPQEISGQSFEHPNVVVIVQNTDNKELSAISSQLSEIRFGLKETEIQHSKGLITKDEVRAVTIHKLMLPQKGVFWDLGAGSGSVSVEAARLCPELKVYAVEKSEEQIKYLNANKERFETDNLDIIEGEAPEALKALPPPDRVFIGGSSGRLYDIVNVISTEMTSGIIVVNATTIETLNEAMQCLEQNNFEVRVSEVSISRSKVIGQRRHMSALNPVFIVIGKLLFR